MRPLHPRTTLLAGLLAVLLGACVGPTPTVDTYREHGAGALEDAGEVAAALELIALNAAADDLPKHFATTLVREQEHRVVYAHTAFADRQPPDTSDDTRSYVLDLLDQAVTRAEEARILVDRGDLAEFGALAATYRDLHAQLEVAEAELRSPVAGRGTR